MKKAGFLLTAVIVLSFLTAGCQDSNSADEYINGQITDLKTNDAESFSFLLTKDIDQINRQYSLPFPNALKKPYLLFLQRAFHTIEFKVDKAQKVEKDIYSVRVSYTPLNIADTVQTTTDKHLAHMSSCNLTKEVSSLLKECENALKNTPVYEESAQTTIYVKRTEHGFQIQEDTKEAFLSQVLQEYMSPYTSVCEILSVRDMLISYLEASLKKAHTFTPPASMTSSYKSEYAGALKKLFKQCRYRVGIPQKEPGLYNYKIDVTITPNNSMRTIFAELETGAYYSKEEIDQTLIELMKKYAKNPVYGKKIVSTISINADTFNSGSGQDPALAELIETILPTQ